MEGLGHTDVRLTTYAGTGASTNLKTYIESDTYQARANRG